MVWGAFGNPALIWGVFLRLVGAVQLIALVSLGSQLRALAGPRGATPFGLVLERVRRDYDTWPARLRRLPTLCWLSGCSERALLGIAAFGGGCGALLLLGGGGACSPIIALGAWAALLSLDEAADLKFPWDSLLLELSSLCVLLPPMHAVGGSGSGGGSDGDGGMGGGGDWSALALSEVALCATPHPWLSFAFRLLLFRLMFGFGKLKFAGSTTRDATYIKSFLVGVPLPTPLGHWLFRHAPDALWVVALAGMFAIEIVAPFLLFGGGLLRVGAALSIAALQVGIQATGNFGHFNMLTAVLCVPMLDDEASLFDASLSEAFGLSSFSGSSSNGGGLLPACCVALYVAVHTLGALLLLPFNSWCTLGSLSWPALAAPPFALVDVYETLACRLRLVHAYGIFPPNSGPPVRFAQVLEGSADGGVTWEPYEWAHATCSECSAPQFLSPHHPRLDFAVFYTSIGADAENLTVTASRASPYAMPCHTLTHRIMQRLLEGGSPVQDLFGHNPFPDTRGPPEHVRARLYTFRPRGGGDSGGGLAEFTTGNLVAGAGAGVGAGAMTRGEKRGGGGDAGTGKQRTGQHQRWWHRRPAGPHVAPRSLATVPRLWQEFPSPPELAHPETFPTLSRQCAALRRHAEPTAQAGNTTKASANAAAAASAGGGGGTLSGGADDRTGLVEDEDVTAGSGITLAQFWRVAAFVGDATEYGRWNDEEDEVDAGTEGAAPVMPGARITRRARALRAAFSVPIVTTADDTSTAAASSTAASHNLPPAPPPPSVLRGAHLVWGRLTARLMRRLEPHYKALKPEDVLRPALTGWPQGEGEGESSAVGRGVTSFLMLALLAHDVLATGGEAAYTAVMGGGAVGLVAALEGHAEEENKGKAGRPIGLLARARALTPARALYATALFRHDLLLMHARKARLQAALQPGHAVPLPSGNPLPGVLELLPFLAAQWHRGGEELTASLPQTRADVAETLPTCIDPEPFGNWTVKDYQA